MFPEFPENYFCIDTTSITPPTQLIQRWPHRSTMPRLADVTEAGLATCSFISADRCSVAYNKRLENSEYPEWTWLNKSMVLYSEAMCVDPQFVIMPLFTSAFVAAPALKFIRIHAGWKAPTNIWWAGSAPPGAHKSGVFSLMSKGVSFMDITDQFMRNLQSATVQVRSSQPVRLEFGSGRASASLAPCTRRRRCSFAATSFATQRSGSASLACTRLGHRAETRDATVVSPAWLLYSALYRLSDLRCTVE